MMKIPYPCQPLMLTSILVFSTANGIAQTAYDGSGAIDVAGNWSSGVPNTVGNPGTVTTADGGNGGMRSGTFFLTQNGGNLFTSFGGATLTSGSWTLNSGSVTANTFTLQTSQIFVQNGGSLTAGASSGDLNITTSSSYTLTAGSLNLPDDLIISAGFTMTGGTLSLNGTTGRISLSSVGSFAISGGSATVTDGIGTQLSATGTMAFSGGTVTASTFDFGGSGTTATFGGIVTGSVTVNDFAGTAASRNLDWLGGTKMSLTIANGVSNWAELEWNAGRLEFDGDNRTALGGLTWSDATDSMIGLGGGYYWDYDNTSKTLALGAIPEPSAISLLVLTLGVGLLFRHRLHA